MVMAPFRPVAFYAAGTLLVLIGGVFLTVTLMSLATGTLGTVVIVVDGAVVLTGLGLIAAGVHRWDCNRLQR